MLRFSFLRIESIENTSERSKRYSEMEYDLSRQTFDRINGEFYSSIVILDRAKEKNRDIVAILTSFSLGLGKMYSTRWIYSEAKES